MAVMTESKRPDAGQVECAEWEHYANGHYRPKVLESGASILVFEDNCPARAQQGETCGACGGSGGRYEPFTMPDGQQGLKWVQCTAGCTGGKNHHADWQQVIS